MSFATKRKNKLTDNFFIFLFRIPRGDNMAIKKITIFITALMFFSGISNTLFAEFLSLSVGVPVQHTFDDAEKISLRCSLLTMAKDILQTKAQMRWQSHNQIFPHRAGNFVPGGHHPF